MSKRAVEALEEQLGFLGPKRLSEVESAQDRVIQIVRRLEEDEEIILDTGKPTTLSYSKTIKFSSPPKAIKVNQIALPPVPVEQSNEYARTEYERGKKEATEFYQQEIQKLRDNYAKEQSTLLSSIDNKTNDVISKLDHRLPDLVIGLAERVLAQIPLDKESIEQIVKKYDFRVSGDDEKLDVYLCPKDLELLRLFSDSEKIPNENKQEEEDKGLPRL